MKTMKMYNFVVDDCILTSRISDYPLISHGKTRIPGVNDGEDFELTDVSVFQHCWKRNQNEKRSTRFFSIKKKKKFSPSVHTSHF